MGTGNPFNSENQGSIDRTAVAAGSPATEMEAATSKLQDDARQDTVTKIKQVATDLVGNIAAGTAGACAFSLLAAEGPWGKALSVPLSFVAGGLTNYGVKDGLEHLLLPEQSRTLKTSDLIFGGFAGIAGVTAAAADGSVSATLARSIGRHQIGENVTAAAAQSAGRSLIEGNALTALKFNALRGITAGGIGSFTYSVPYEAYANWNQLQENPAAGISHLLSATAFDTAVGAATGGILGAGSTALARSPELIGRANARLGGDGGVLKVREFSVNDVHSNLENWPKLATAVEARSAKATADGVYSEFNAAGDTSSGHVNYSFTNHGQVENENLANMGLKNIIPGNHDYDAPGGKFHPERYPGIMA
ncbi:MAG TPA: hypothetical protein V6C72_05020, partial [Chroococcales cyanobacterium]